MPLPTFPPVPRLAPLAAAAVAALALASCGGDDDEGSVTKQDYIREADEICQGLSEERDPLEAIAAGDPGSAGAGDESAAARAFADAADITRDRVAELADLPRPSGAEAETDEFVATAETTVPPAENANAAIEAGDDAALSEASARGLAATRRFDRVSVAYGFLVCGRGAAEQIG